MTRADLHHALAVDREIFEASQVDPTVLDPVVRIEGGLPGVARPFVVTRAYQGPQGDYIEQFALSDRAGNELYRSPRRRIRLKGEMFEDRFTSTVTQVGVRSGAEHRLTLFVNDDEVGAIPVFVETAAGGDLRVAVEETFTAALKKGSILWVTVPPRPNGRKGPAKPHTQPVWYIVDGGKVYVLTGKTEQDVPGLADSPQVEISARSKDIRSLVARVPADVSRVSHDDPRWDKFTKAALTRRLNLEDGDAALERWKANCVLVELSPRFREADEDGEQARRPAPAATAAADQPAGAAAGGQKKEAAEEIHVEAQIDQAVFDKLIAEGKSERVARAQAKAAYVRAEKKRIRAEQESAAS